jgi:hypothetical protein
LVPSAAHREAQPQSALARFFFVVSLTFCHRPSGAAMPDFGIPDIDPELAEPLGQIVIRWSSVEYLISMLLGTLVFADLAGIQVITTNIAVSAQTKWIRALMSVNQPTSVDHKDRVEALLARADDLRSERNEFIHGHWDTTNCEPKTALVQTVNLDRNEVIRERLVTKQDLSDLVTDIEEWIRDYVSLGRELSFPRHRDSTKSIFLD